MRTAQRPLQLLDALLLLGIGPRGRASPPKRSLGSFFHFIFPAIVKRRGNLVLAARLSHVAALQTFQHNLPLLFRSSLNFRLSRHSRLLAEAPVLLFEGCLRLQAVFRSQRLLGIDNSYRRLKRRNVRLILEDGGFPQEMFQPPTHLASPRRVLVIDFAVGRDDRRR